MNHPLFDAFVSYSSSDRVWVHGTLVPTLEAAELNVHTDEDFAVGVSVARNIEAAIRRSRRVVLILTPEWLRSSWTSFEHMLATVDDPMNRSQRLVPVMLVDCELPHPLRVFTYLDLRDDSTREARISRLIDIITGGEPRPTTAPQPTATTAVPTIGAARTLRSARLDPTLGLAEARRRLLGVEAQALLATLEARLLDNLGAESRFGAHESGRVDRARVIDELNKLCLTELSITFTELCRR